MHTQLLRAPADLDALLPAWTALAAAASEPNPFHEAPFLRAALDHLDPRAEVSLLVGFGPGRRLDLVLPVERRRSWLGVPLPHWRAWNHHQTALTQPLVRAGQESAAVAALAERGLVVLPIQPLDGALSGAIARMAAREDAMFQTIPAGGRALLRCTGDAESHLARVLSGRKRRELRRLRRKLAAQGPVAFHVSSTPDETARGLAVFLALEAAGWKGRQGTAMASRLRDRRLVEALGAWRASAWGLEVVSLTVGGRPIAAQVQVRSGRGAFTFKGAYDEDFAHHSPGVLLQLDNIRRLMDDPGVDWVDSLALPGHPVVDRLFADRRETGTVLLAPAGRRGRALLRAATTLRDCEVPLRRRLARHLQPAMARLRMAAGAAPAPPRLARA